MITVDCEYNIAKDIEFLMESEKINSVEFSNKTKVSRTTILEILKSGKARNDVSEKIYAYAYDKKYRINSVKEELLQEKYQTVLFHGSKDGLSDITMHGSRDNCDFGSGFYLGETYHQALSFVCEKENSSVYSFRCSLDNLRIKRFECDLEWMLAICYFRGTIKNFENDEFIRKIVTEVESADLVIAPIADNKMFYIMAQFTEGEINADVALHSLSASKLGLQYIFKTDKAIDRLIPIEKYYICKPEREDCKLDLIERGFEIDTKLKLAKIQKILNLLDNEYGTEFRCYLEHDSAWQLLFATILSAQCTDARVNIVTRDLFVKYPNIEAFAKADLKELENDIKPTGFYHNKAKNIIGCAQALIDKYDGTVPSDIDSLTSLPGVGRKTANVIRGNIYGIPSIVVDTHVKRISNKLGVTKETDPVKIEFDLMKKLPKDHWILWNIDLIRLGRTICKAPTPKCEECFLKDVCPSHK